jgi:hypothetical protein
MESPYSIWQQVLAISLGPPVIALVFYILASGRVSAVFGGKIPDKTKIDVKNVALAMMGAGWIVGFGGVILVHVFPGVIRWMQGAQ